jgi:hypothetical protein
MIRNTYMFGCHLDDNASTLLALLVGWRKGSSLISSDDGVVGRPSRGR